MRFYLVLVICFAFARAQWIKINNGGPALYSTEPLAMPEGRESAAMWCHDDDIYVFGGTGTYSALGDLWKFETETNRWFWQPQPPSELGERTQMASWYLNGKFWIYGGTNNAGAVYADMWTYDPATRKWAILTNASHVPVSGAAAWTHPQTSSLYLYKDPGQFYVFRTETGAWERLHLRGSAPGSPPSTALGFEQDRVYALSYELYEYDVSTNLWSQTNTSWNSPRDGASIWLTSEQNKVLIFGGKDGSQLLSDLWEYDIEKREWTQLRNNKPGERAYASLCTSQTGSTYIFGGSLHNDLWKYGRYTRQDLLDALNDRFTSTAGFAMAAMILSLFTFLFLLGWSVVSCISAKRNKDYRRRRELSLMAETIDNTFTISE